MLVGRVSRESVLLGGGFAVFAQLLLLLVRLLQAELFAWLGGLDVALATLLVVHLGSSLVVPWAVAFWVQHPAKWGLLPVGGLVWLVCWSFLDPSQTLALFTLVLYWFQSFLFGFGSLGRSLSLYLQRPPPLVPTAFRPPHLSPTQDLQELHQWRRAVGNHFVGGFLAVLAIPLLASLAAFLLLT